VRHVGHLCEMICSGFAQFHKVLHLGNFCTLFSGTLLYRLYKATPMSDPMSITMNMSRTTANSISAQFYGRLYVLQNMHS
jgi:hypothetical protein